jgi:predicted amidophosphoribosyltransferase
MRRTHTLPDGPLRSALREAWAVVAPTRCSGCGEQDQALCAACLLALRPAVHRSVRDDFVVWSALDYSGVARQVLASFKDGGRTDAAPPLAELLIGVIRSAVASGGAVDSGSAIASGSPAADAHQIRPGDLHLVTIPSSRQARRSRGYDPVGLLLKRAGLRADPVLAQVREVADQVGLGREERLTNKEGSLAAQQSLSGFRCLIVDDILTTGATVREARRAVHEAGGEVVAVVTVAETRLRGPEVTRPAETNKQNP